MTPTLAPSTVADRDAVLVGTRCVDELDTTGVAVALARSGVRLHKRLTDDEVFALVAAGVANLGGLAATSRWSDIALDINLRDDDGAHRNLWGSPARARLCATLAWRVAPPFDYFPVARPQT
ncbi:hypothetical protein [Actinokineospora diospyrosa]|uniref:Uncharacterized protein n=1 Tax=Actinokineospora diospyrosa TaxID=103728 RepID=A0ABT1IH07_9PSEU|nr:hypothetical protein [Actinokineospora diospyrosa]MCP2271927.1 hypothetical protein [Actinokineospora diospyrosa]